MKIFALTTVLLLSIHVYAGGKIPSIGPKKRWAGAHAGAPILSLDKLGKNRVGWFEPIVVQELNEKLWSDEGDVKTVAVYVDPTGKKIIGRSDVIDDCDKFISELNSKTTPQKISTSSHTFELGNSDIVIDGKSIIGNLMPTRGDSTPGEEEADADGPQSLMHKACWGVSNLRHVGQFSSIHLMSAFGPYLQFEAESVEAHGCQQSEDEIEYSSAFVFLRRDSSGSLYRAALRELIDEEKNKNELAKAAKKMNKDVDSILGMIGPCGLSLIDDRFVQKGVQFVLDDYDIKNDKIVGRLWDTQDRELVRDSRALSVSFTPHNDTIRGYLKEAKAGNGLISGKKPVAVGSPTTWQTYRKFFQTDPDSYKNKDQTKIIP